VFDKAVEAMMVLYEAADKGRGYRLPLHAVPERDVRGEEYAMLTNELA